MYKSILKAGEDEFIEKKSKFIGYSKPVLREEEALEFISEIKLKHRDATHNCSAYIIGENLEIQRYSDDGEPSGTAGLPMLSVLKKENLTNICVVVTRYFGGTMLGAGGLVRAYTQGAKIAVESGKIVEVIEFYKVKLRYDYTLHGSLENFLITQGYSHENFEFTDKVAVDVFVKKDMFIDFKEDVDNLSSARTDLEIVDELNLPVLDGKLIV